MISQDVTKTSKFCGSLVGEAKLEGFGSCHCIQSLKTSIVSEHIQYCSVCLPQELEPWCD